MGRSRRRNRRGHFISYESSIPFDEAGEDEAGAPEPDVIPAPLASVDETLEPTYETVGAAAWAADSDTPVLALEGLPPGADIPSPALDLLMEPPAESIAGDSDDPDQLELAAAAGPVVAAEVPPVPEVLPAPPQAVAPPAAPEPVADATGTPAPFDDLDLDLDDDTDIAEADRAAIESLINEAAGPAFDAVALPIVADMAAAVTAAVPSEAAAEAPVAEAEPEVEPEPEPPVDPVEELHAQARDAAGEGRRADARALYRQVLTQRPAHVRARNNLALLLEADGAADAALAEYDRAIETDADNATVLVNRGALLGQMGRYAAAERDLKKVLRVEPAHVDALFSLGVVMTKKGLWGEAVPQLRRVVELDPERGSAHFYLGEALNHVDDLTGAMAAYQRAAELLPAHPRALYGLGIVYDRMGRPDDAARMYRRSRDVGRAR